MKGNEQFSSLRLSLISHRDDLFIAIDDSNRPSFCFSPARGLTLATCRDGLDPAPLKNKKKRARGATVGYKQVIPTGLTNSTRDGKLVTLTAFRLGIIPWHCSTAPLTDHCVLAWHCKI